jgi:hypothetical protein
LEFETITIAGITISEPVTSFTDVILAIISFILVGKIRSRLNESFFNNAWKLFFLFMGISTAIGAVAHAVRQSVPPATFNAIWMAMNISCSISVFFALQATIRFSRAGILYRKILRGMNYGLLVLFFGYTIVMNDFEIFKIHAGLGLFLIFLTYFIAWLRSHHGSGWIVTGMLLSFLTVVVHSTRFSIDAWFNYKDISHVIMMASLVLLYTGIFQMSQNLKLSVFRARN